MFRLSVCTHVEPAVDIITFEGVSGSKQNLVDVFYARRELLREILYKNIAIIAINHSKMYFVDTIGDFSHTVEWNSFKSISRISLYTLA